AAGSRPHAESTSREASSSGRRGTRGIELSGKGWISRAEATGAGETAATIVLRTGVRGSAPREGERVVPVRIGSPVLQPQPRLRQHLPHAGAVELAGDLRPQRL